MNYSSMLIIDLFRLFLHLFLFIISSLNLSCLISVSMGHAVVQIDQIFFFFFAIDLRFFAVLFVNLATFVGVFNWYPKRCVSGPNELDEMSKSNLVLTSLVLSSTKLFFCVFNSRSYFSVIQHAVLYFFNKVLVSYMQLTP